MKTKQNYLGSLKRDLCRPPASGYNANENLD
jgi:hypothetical protein